MAKSEDNEETKIDDLEIIAIGSLYRGPHDKKYWSCSRAKDRYPYPVGYHAVRFHDGSMCKMEIHEGSKGPLFVISSADGHSCSGQTPTIAWEKFQKKGVPRMKIWHGKRFSCKIDGIEFFGFKNPFVQRLLRQLVADISENAEQSPLSPSYFNGASVTEEGSERTDLCLKPYSSTIPPEHQTTGNQRCGKIVKLEKAAICERLETQIKRDIKVTYSRKKRQKISKSTESTVFPDPEVGVVVKDSLETFPEIASFSSVSESCDMLKAAEGSTTRNLANFSSFLDRKASSEEKTDKHPEVCRSAVGEESVSLDRLQVDETNPLSPSMLKETINKEAAFIKDSDSINDAVLFVDDTVQESQGNMVQIVLHDTVNVISNLENNSCKSNDESTAANVEQPAEGLLTESHQEELVTYHSGESSERSEFDAVGLEIANSMMTFLLPQALPLLNMGSKNKKERKRTSTMKNPLNDSTSWGNDNIDQSHTSNPVADANDASILGAKVDDETTDAGNGNYSSIPSTVLPNGKYEGPLSERIVLRNSGESYHRKTCAADENFIVHENFEVTCDEQTNDSRSVAGEPLLDVQLSVSGRENLLVKGLDVKKDTVKSKNDLLYEGATSDFPEIEAFLAEENLAGSQYKLDEDVKLHNELEGTLQLVGCYSHPLPVLSIVLRQHGNELYLCVQCGLLVDEVRTLFLYKLLIEEPKMGRPSFIGQTSVLHPIPNFSIGIVPDRSCFQLTPDGQGLILLGNIKTPCCSERRISCSCTTCASLSLDDYKVRIVQVNIGYVTTVVTLNSVDRILSLLVCEPNHLVAVGESGRLHTWIMDPTWSRQIEEFDLPASECVSPGILDLKKLPKRASLVVGYNGFGEFTLWDISSRIYLKKFVALGTSVHHFLPIGSLSLRQKDTRNPDMDENITNELMATTTKMFQDSDGSDSNLRLKRDDIAIWLLASAVSDAEDDYLANTSAAEYVGQWRLALLANSKMISGSPLDSRAAAVAAFSGYGVIGTRDGLVYLWELCTGNKVRALRHFEGIGVSCIATDDSTSSVLAISGGNGELMVYQRPRSGCTVLQV